MTRLFALLFLAVSLHAAGPVRCAFDAQVVNWNYRCLTNDLYGNGNLTQSLIASSVWMGGVRALGLYPGNILRANLMCGVSYGGTNGAGDFNGLSAFNYNIGSPQVPLINDVGGAVDTCNIQQFAWYYRETGSTAGLGVAGAAGNVLDTGFSPSTPSSWDNDAHVAIYMMGGSGAQTDIIVGVSQDGTSIPDLFITSTYTALGQTTGMWTYVGDPANADTTGTGLYLGTRVSSSADGVKQYRNGVSTGASSSVGSTASTITRTVYVFAQNYNGTVANASTNRSAGYAFGRAISSTTQGPYYQVWQNYETLLGRQK